MAFHYRGNPGWLRAHPVTGQHGDGREYGCVDMPNPFSGPPLALIFAAGDGWEHVSVSTTERVPSWAEMCFVKRLFWDDEDVVMQLHPARSNYVNRHPFCLHLWRPIGVPIPTPDLSLV